MTGNPIINPTHVRVSAALAFLVGAWLVVVNFIIWEPVVVAGPWNHAITGLAVLIMAGYRLARPGVSRGMSAMIAALGLWLIASPFVFGYSLVRTVLWGDVIAGLLLVISGIWGVVAGGARRDV
jgi:hypothetical protein